MPDENISSKISWSGEEDYVPYYERLFSFIYILSHDERVQWNKCKTTAMVTMQRLDT